MVSRIRAYIRDNRMIEPKDRVLAGLSGGADSVCLLFVLLELRRELDFELFCAHVNHNLRGEESARDEAFVRELCRAQGVPLVCRSCRVRERAEEEGRSLEEMGRICRYEAFGEIAGEQGCSRIAVAHHADDQAETMLFHLFRGTGIRGLSGMRPVRGKVIRPLLILESKEIREWLAERGIAWCTDSTNQSEDYTRNRIRRTVLPCAREQVNPGAVRHMAETARELWEIEDFLGEKTEEAFRLCVRREDEGCFLLEEVFARFRPVIARRVLLLCLKETGGLRDVERRHTELLWKLFEQGTGSSLDLPKGRRAVREYKGVWIGRRSAERDESGSARPAVPGSCRTGAYIWTFSLENADKSQIIPKKTYTKWFDYDKIIQCLEIRKRRPGDYLEINKEHGRKKLKDFLIDEKVPAREREKLWLLADGSHILWIPGMRISEAYKVTEHTIRVLKVQLCGGNEDGREDQGDDFGRRRGCED